MFIHAFRYSILQSFRQKATLFWNLLFPIILGTLFHFAFGGLSSDEMFHAIPVAVILEEHTAPSSFQQVIASLDESQENSLLKVTYTTKEEALSLLERKEIVGILWEGSPVNLTVSADMTSMRLEQSILNCFVERYNMQYSAIEQIALHHPEGLSAALNMLGQDTDYNTETSYSNGSMDEQITYFFNLIAMSCLFAAMGGIQIAIRNQANLSSLGARQCVSPVPKFFSYLGMLCATFLYQFLCIAVGLIYLITVLKVNFGHEIGYVMLTALLGCITGVSFGFFIGCIGNLSQSVKFGIQMASTMLCCILSGLVAGNIRIYIEKICPWFNKINPAALISDSFYALTVYQSHRRYFQNSITLVIISALFCLCGLCIIRRNKYAAL